MEKRLSVHVSTPYDVVICRGALQNLGAYIRNVHKGTSLMVVTDSHVEKWYLEEAAASLRAAGYRVETFVFPAGEESKCAKTYLALLNALAEKGLTRTDLIVALGGGVVGDMAGFAAATYLRGIPYVQIPTTLLSMVDSSVGGKTAIDLPAGKNLCGAFYQPALVLCDPDVLATLPEDVFCAGCAEVIKYGFIGDRALLESILHMPIRQQPEEIIFRSVAMKRDIVQKDERDTGLRQLLNFGHTFGHAIEKLSKYTLSHGQAVAMGMDMMCKAAVRRGFCDAQVTDLMEKLLRAYGLEQKVPFSAADIYRTALQDKKRDAECVALVIPVRPGTCELKKVSVSDLLFFAEEGLKA
ncbi:MAG: 3-dehydroquinate synthase [Clostridia bacterium]|nr:3-dehydroquinate synthase [Clostridia bacterium]